MNKKRTWGSWLGVGALVLATIATGGVANAVSYNMTRSAQRITTSGSTFELLSDSATTFCYLSRVYKADTDTNLESAVCNINIDGGTNKYFLEAHIGAFGDADVACTADCYNR